MAGTEVQGQPSRYFELVRGPQPCAVFEVLMEEGSSRILSVHLLGPRMSSPIFSCLHPPGNVSEDPEGGYVLVSYTGIQPAVDALEQLLFYRTESGRAPSDPDPLDFVTARALFPLIHHPDFIVALLRACSR